MIIRSRKRKQKAELLKILNKKSFSTEWEERYFSMYGISRYMWRGGKFNDLKNTYQNVLRLLEEFVYGVYSNFDDKEIVKLWMDSFFLLWDKIKSMEKSKKQHHLMKCVENLFRSDMEEYLSKKDYREL